MPTISQAVDGFTTLVVHISTARKPNSTRAITIQTEMSEKQAFAAASAWADLLSHYHPIPLPRRHHDG